MLDYVRVINFLLLLLLLLLLIIIIITYVGPLEMLQCKGWFV